MICSVDGNHRSFFFKKIMWHSQLLPSTWIVYVQKPYLDLRGEGEAPQRWKRVSEAPREWHCRNPLCYLRHPFLLSNTIKADTANWRPTRELLCQGEIQVDESGVSSLLIEKNFGPQTCNTFLFRKHWNCFEALNVISPSQDTKLKTGILIPKIQYHSLKGKIHHIYH